MSQTSQKNTGFNTHISIFNKITSKYIRFFIFGLILTIVGFSLFFAAIILFVNIGPLGLIAAIPMPFCIFFGLRMLRKYSFSGVGNAFKKVKKYLKKENLSMLNSLTSLPIADNSTYAIINENYFTNLFAVAALADLNEPNIVNIAVGFYKKLTNKSITTAEAIVILKYIAQKEGKKTYREYIDKV